jgi:hypothetical protein
MGLSEKLSNVRQLLLPGSNAAATDERLLQLYWNRAELKKELSRLQDQCRRQLEILKREEGETQRVRDHLDQLEEYLGVPDAAPHALLYFQLRALWKLCAGKLVRFSLQLQRQQEERERRRQQIEFDQRRRLQLADIERRLIEARSNADVLEAQLKLLEVHLADLRGFWNYFGRRRLALDITNERSAWEIATGKVAAVVNERIEVENTPAAEFPGISVDGRRIVNTAVIAFAQQLVEALSKDGLAMLAKETTATRVFDVRYGTAEQCAALMLRVRQAAAQIDSENEDLMGLKQRTEALRANASYRSDADTVPLTDSVGVQKLSTVVVVSGLETANRAGINVLVDDYWNLYQALAQ